MTASENPQGGLDKSVEPAKPVATKSLTTHWHLRTSSDPTTPPYPHEEARHIYLTACAKSFNSSKQNQEYKLTQFHKDEVNCERCLIWLGWKAEES